MKNKPYFPMFIDLSDKNIVVVGGGNIATRRVKTLLSFTRNIRVIAPKVTMEIRKLAQECGKNRRTICAACRKSAEEG